MKEEGTRFGNKKIQRIDRAINHMRLLGDNSGHMHRDVKKSIKVAITCMKEIMSRRCVEALCEKSGEED